MKSLGWTLLVFVSLGAPLAAQDAKGSAFKSNPMATVLVHNQLSRTVTVWIDGEMKGRVEPAQSARFMGVKPGSVSLQAGAAGSAGPVAGEERRLEPGETFTWTLYPLLDWEEEKGTGTVVVANGLDRVVDVFLGGAPAGSLGPGATRAYPRVVAGDVEVSARGDDGATVRDTTLVLAPGKIARWEIGGTDSSRRADRGD